MTGGTVDLPPGQDLPVRRRWWRHLRHLALMLLAVASLVALIVGRATSAELTNLSTEPAVPLPVADARPGSAAAACRPPLQAPVQEPWLRDPAAAEAVWQDHSDEVGKDYLVGPNGWVFWSDQVTKYASQAVGRALLSKAQVRQWVDQLTDLHDFAAKRGVEFYVIVAPSTSSIYPEELPTWMQGLRGSTIMDQVIGATGDFPIIDLRANLLTHKHEPVHLFSWSNSHWTDYGAFIAWTQIAQCVSLLYPAEKHLQVPEIRGAIVTGDFNEWGPLGVSSPGADWTAPDYVTPFREVARANKDGDTEVVKGQDITYLASLPATTTVSEPWTGKSALIFRDSMGDALSPLWEQAYSPTWQLPQPYITPYTSSTVFTDAIEEHHPDVVIVQLAERYLFNAPPQGAGY